MRGWGPTHLSLLGISLILAPNVVQPGNSVLSKTGGQLVTLR